MVAIIGKLFKAKVEEETDIMLHAFMDGKIVDFTEIEDSSFSQGVWGEGIAIEPKTGTIVSPVSGTISEVDEISGIISISTEHHVNVLIHAGIQMELHAKKISKIISETETTTNKETPILEVFAELGQHVEVGDVIMKLNLDLMKDNEIRVIVPMVVAHRENFILQMIEEKNVIEKEKGLVISGKPIAKLKEPT